MERLLKVNHQLCQTLECQQISAGSLRMAPVSEAFGLTHLRGTQAFRASGQMGLFQRLRSQAPADRKPSESLGNRAR